MNTMNVYLDIDGVLLIDETHAANYANEFLQTILEKYPDSTYWLTTHNWNGENRAKGVLAPYLKPATVKLLDKIKPTKWNELKTDAINFDEDFLWFDDDLWPDELKALEEHEAAEQFILVKLDEDPDMLKRLAEVVKANK
jgi:hypothetical protein